MQTKKNHALYTGVVFTIYTLVDISWEPIHTPEVTLSDNW